MCGGEVGAVSQAISESEFGIDPPRMAISWAGREANAMYDNDYVPGAGDAPEASSPVSADVGWVDAWYDVRSPRTATPRSTTSHSSGVPTERR